MNWAEIGVIAEFVVILGSIGGAVMKYGQLTERVENNNKRIERHEHWCGEKHDERLKMDADTAKWRETVVSQLSRIETIVGNGPRWSQCPHFESCPSREYKEKP